MLQLLGVILGIVVLVGVVASVAGSLG
ncbi:hypothetical protein ACFQ0T_10580 [Kitasatospora gansuensis]